MTSSVEKPRHGKQFTPINNIWRAPICSLAKLNIFRMTVEKILIYGCDSWSLTQTVEHALDGTYTRMLQKIQNMSWRHHMTNQQLYSFLPQITNIVRQRRLRLAGHVMRHDEVAKKSCSGRPMTIGEEVDRQQLKISNKPQRDKTTNCNEELKPL